MTFDDGTPAQEVNRDLLQFGNILSNMGMSDDALDGLVEDFDEEERKE